MTAQAPALNRRLVLETSQRAADGAGGFQEIWQPLGTFWGAIRPRAGRVVDGEAGAVSQAGFRITVRAAPLGHSQRPVPGQRFAMGARRFRIASVTEQEPRGAYLICEAEEELAA